jgi:hypothetical protein
MDLFIGGWVEPDQIHPLALYHNNGNGTFTDVTQSAGIFQSAARVGVWGDYNNDGRIDLFVVDGVTTASGANEPDMLYLNLGNGTFAEGAQDASIQGPSTGGGDSAAWADFNRDGSLDLAVANGSGYAGCGATSNPPCYGQAKLYRNEPTGRHWLELRLIASTDYYGFGSKVSITVNGATQYRQMTDQASGGSQNEQILHFGLNNKTTVGNLTIEWPNGQQVVMNNVSADQLLTVTQ